MFFLKKGVILQIEYKLIIMEASLVTKLKNILENTTQEEFDKEWNSILELELSGPTIEDFVDCLIDNNKYDFKNEVNINYCESNLASAA